MADIADARTFTFEVLCASQDAFHRHMEMVRRVLHERWQSTRHPADPPLIADDGTPLHSPTLADGPTTGLYGIHVTRPRDYNTPDLIVVSVIRTLIDPASSTDRPDSLDELAGLPCVFVVQVAFVGDRPASGAASTGRLHCDLLRTMANMFSDDLYFGNLNDDLREWILAEAKRFEPPLPAVADVVVDEPQAMQAVASPLELEQAQSCPTRARIQERLNLVRKYFDSGLDDLGIQMRLESEHGIVISRLTVKADRLGMKLRLRNRRKEREKTSL